MRVKKIRMKENKEITFIIGNGFDCKYKLQVTYNHFLDYYLSIPSPSTLVEKFKDNIRAEKDESGYGTWSYLELKMGSYRTDTLAEFIECYDDITEEIAKYLRYVVQNNVGLTSEDLEDVDLFAEGFLHFLIDFLRIKTENPESIAQLREEYRSSPNKYNFIVLNYTSILSDCISELKKRENFKEKIRGEEQVVYGDILQPHGDLDHIVFGVSDLSQVCPNFADEWEYRRRIIKSERIKDFGATWLDDGKKMIFRSDIIGIFGASLGETDNHWWEMLANWLSASTNHKLIIYFYLPKDSVEFLSEVAYRETEQRLKGKFLRYFPEKPEMESQIFLTFEEQKFVEMFVKIKPQPITIDLDIKCTLTAVPASEAKELLISEKKDA